MNRVQQISRRATWCQLKRLQSSVSTSNSQIQIPTRIKRGPTDILRALANTVPNDPIAVHCPYHDDPFLLPMKKTDYRNYSLSYESGKKTAMWIHKEHRDLFPKHLSDPEIEAFTPPTKYTDKDQVSEEMFLNVISRCNISDALHIYKLLEGCISNKAKQALFELLCFYNDDANMLTEFPYQRWFIKPNNKYIWRYTSEIDELYQFLTTQDSATAAAAHNVMICCLTRYSRVDEAWSVYQQCITRNVPLNVTTYNYILLLLPEIFRGGSTEKVHYMLSILQTMNNKSIKPNVRTLNAALRVVSLSKTDQAKDIVKHLLMEFKRIDVKLSLASYYYAMKVFVLYEMNTDSYTYFQKILSIVEEKSFTIQDPEDNKFFTTAMKLANHYTDKNAAERIHNLLLAGNNKRFLSDTTIEQFYYSEYISVLFLTNTIEEFFKHYVNLIPHVYIPSKFMLQTIIKGLQNRATKDVMEYLPRLWSDVNAFCFSNISLQFSILRLMSQSDNLPIDSPLRASFVNAALTSATNIAEETIKENRTTNDPIAADMIGCIANILVRNSRLEECVKVLTHLVKEANIFVPVMSEEQTEQLFDACISEKCIEGAFLVLKYSLNTEFPYTAKMIKKLRTVSELTDIQRDKLTNLMGAEARNTSGTF